MFKTKTSLILASIFISIYVPSISYANHESTGQYVKSSSITADIKARFLADPDIKSLHIKVKTIRYKVILTGYVNSEDEKNKAESIANEVKGVKEVRNKLIVRHH